MLHACDYGPDRGIAFDRLFQYVFSRSRGRELPELGRSKAHLGYKLGYNSVQFPIHMLLFATRSEALKAADGGD